MFCTRCGSQVQEGARFCTRCGAEITQTGMMQTETVGRMNQQISDAQAGNKNQIAAVIAICSVLVVAIVALIIVLVMPFGDKKEEKSEREKKQQEVVEKDRDVDDEETEETDLLLLCVAIACVWASLMNAEEELRSLLKTANLRSMPIP